MRERERERSAWSRRAVDQPARQTRLSSCYQSFGGGGGGGCPGGSSHALTRFRIFLRPATGMRNPPLVRFPHAGGGPESPGRAGRSDPSSGLRRRRPLSRVAGPGEGRPGSGRRRTAGLGFEIYGSEREGAWRPAVEQPFRRHPYFPLGRWLAMMSHT